MPQFNFTRAKVGRKALACVAMVPDIEDAKEGFFELCLLGRYDYDSAGPVKWFSDPEETLQMSVASITKYIAPGETNGPFVALSHEGDVFFDGRPSWYERIPGTGIYKPDSKGWGRLTMIRQIGSKLYACGERGQLFVRRGSDQWTHLDKGLLTSADDEVDEDRNDPEGFSAASEKRLQGILRGEELRLVLYDINGPGEDDIYICGNAVGHPWQRGRIYHWNGEKLAEIPVRSQNALTKILVQDEDTIWICGRSGQLLKGNHRDGFLPVPGMSGDQLFTSMTLFQDKIYLASAGGRSVGLFVYDGQRLKRVITPLEPNIEDIFHVEAVEGVMWTVGTRDVTRFDGSTWTRIDHPDNPPIR